MSDPKEGGHVAPPVITLTDFLRGIGSGEVITDAEEALAKIAEALNQHVQDYGGSPKAKLTITVDFALKKGITEISGTVETKLPKTPARGGVMWIGRDNKFTQQHPNQMQMFPPAPRVVRAAE